MNEGFAAVKTNNTPFLVDKEYWDFVCENSDIEYTMEHTYYQYTTRIIEPLINKLYEKRVEYKDLHKKAVKGTAEHELYGNIEGGLKVLLNSLYGKMCEKGYHVNTVYYDLKYEIYPNPKKKYPCILTGSFITYRARLKLLKTIKQVVESGHDFLYADTDSITLGCDRDADLTPIFGEKSPKLGAWKDEGTYDLYLNIFKKKKYFLVNRGTKKFKLALSGIPKKVQKILEHQLTINFEKTLEDMKKIFDPNENFRFLQCKPNASLNFLDQMIIVNVDFDINGGELDPTGTIEFTEDGYILKKLCQ